MSNLASIVKMWRKSKGLTLQEFGTLVSLPASSLSKIENGKLSLSYDKISLMASALGLSMSELLSINENEDKEFHNVTARRSVESKQNTIEMKSNRYGYEFLCTDILNRKMVPIRIKVKARSVEEFGKLLKHSGEEFLYVLKGSILLLTEHYAPVQLNTNQSAYIDSSAGHGYVSLSDEDAILMIICTEVSAFNSEADADVGYNKLELLGL